ncbi:MAG: 16S rRNA (guanine(966)-N(2))-methyltransferase RsmD [Chloroflexota bacterium]
MSHRVISGSAKGKRLKLVPGNTTRPITDRAKEALFNIIGSDIYDAYWLDLFAGTGAVGIEALSRGAEFVLFNDMERLAITTIEDNLKTTGLAANAKIMRKDAFALLAAPPDEVYDFIYVAPPQYKGIWKDVLLRLEEKPIWIPAGTEVIVQIDPREHEDVKLKHLELADERRYGSTMLCFYVSEYDPEDATPGSTQD